MTSRSYQHLSTYSFVILKIKTTRNHYISNSRQKIKVPFIGLRHFIPQKSRDPVDPQGDFIDPLGDRDVLDRAYDQARQSMSGKTAALRFITI